MRIDEEYNSHLFLSFFTYTKELKISQLFHMLTGKRTASTLYQAMDAHLLDFFGLFGSLSRREFESSIRKMEQLKWLSQIKEDAFSITESGREELRRYFHAHHYPKQVKSLKYMGMTRPAWERLQLITQIFSEKSYANRQYVPVIKNYGNQRWCKQWMKRYAASDENTAKAVASEWRKIFEQLDQKTADALAMRLTGHQHIGATHTQINQTLKMENNEGKFFFLDTLHVVFTLIESAEEQFPLFSSVMKLTNLETFEGLSASTWTTWKYLQENQTVENISRLRKLKIGTVREHIIEIAIVKDTFPVYEYVPKRLYRFLHEKMDEKETVSYQEILESVPDVSFLFYRLVQIERRRQDAHTTTT